MGKPCHWTLHVASQNLASTLCEPQLANHAKLVADRDLVANLERSAAFRKPGATPAARARRLHLPGKTSKSTGRARDRSFPKTPAVVFCNLGGRPHHLRATYPVASARFLAQASGGGWPKPKPPAYQATASKLRLSGKQLARPTSAAGLCIKPSQSEWAS